MPEDKSLWTRVQLDPELVPFIVLSGADISYLTDLAKSADDPVAWLTEELHKRGRKARDLKAFHKSQRMKQDAKMIGDPALWPGLRLPVKTQPWRNEDGKSIRFGHIFRDDLLKVHLRDGNTSTYASIEELVEEWSVD